MGDAQPAEYKTLDYDTTGAADFVEVSGMVVPSGTGAVAVIGASAVATGLEPGILASGIGPGFVREVTGTLDANGETVEINANGADSVVFDVTGDLEATLYTEATLDGTFWFPATANGYRGEGVGDQWSPSSYPDGMSLVVHAVAPLKVRVRIDTLFGSVASAALSSGGSGYAVDDTGYLNGGDSGATYVVDSVDGGGAVLTFHLTAAGTAYQTGIMATINDGAQPGVGTGFEIDVVSVDAGSASVIARAMTGFSPYLLNYGVGGQPALSVAIVSGTLPVSISGIVSTWGAYQRDSAISTSLPLVVGGRAGDTAPSSVSANGDAVDAWFTRFGALNTRLVDDSGDPISVGGGTQYVEDVAFAGNGTGNLMIARRDDALSALTPIEDDAVGLRVGSTGALWVDAGLVAHDVADAGNPVKIGGKASTGPAAVTDGDRVNAWFNAYGAQATFLVHSNSGAAAAIVTANDSLSGANTQGLAAVSFGQLYNGSSWDRARSGGVLGMQGVSGDTAHDAADAGNPQKIGGKASLTLPTAVAAGDRVNAWFDRTGSQGVFLVAGKEGDSVSLQHLAGLGDTQTSNVNALVVASYGLVMNGAAEWVRQRGDISGTWVHGPTASDAPLTIAPLTIGGRASTAVPTAVSADGDVVDARFLRTGALTVHVVDSAGAAASLGGGTQYVEDVALAADAATGTLLIARRDDALSTLTPVEDDAIGLRANSLGALWVDAGLVAHDAVDAGNPVKIGGKASIGQPPTAVASNDRVDAWFDVVGSQAVFLTDRGGSNLPASAPADAASNAGLVSIAFRSVGMLYNGTTWDRQRSGGVTGMAGISGDTAHDAADAGNPQKIGGKASQNTPAQVGIGDRVDAWFDLVGSQGVFLTDVNAGTLTTTAPSDGFSNPVDTLAVRSYGSIWNGTTWDRARSGGVLGMQGVSGDKAHDAGDDGNPLKIGGYASTAVPTSVSVDGDRVNAWFSRTGALVVDGGVVHDAADAGNPIKIGGKASGSQNPSAVSIGGDRADAWFDMHGGQGVFLADWGGLAFVAANPADAAANGTGFGLAFRSYQMLWNGTTWDRARSAYADGITAEGILASGGMLFDGSNWNRQRSGGVNGMAGIAGATVADLAIAANPVTTGGRASTAVPTAVSADGDVVNARFLRTGAQVVHVVDAAGAAQAFGGGTQYTEGDTDASITGTALLWEDAADTLVVASAAKPLPVSLISAIPAGGNNIGDVDVLTVPAPLSTTGGGTEATALRVTIANNSTGLLAVTGTFWQGTQPVSLAALPALVAGSANIGDVDVLTLPGIAGDTANDAVDAGNPIKIGGYAKAAAPTDASADGDRVNAWFVRNGAQVMTISEAGTIAMVRTFSGDGLGVVPGLATVAFNGLWDVDDGSWDRQPGNNVGAYVQGPTAGDAAIVARPLTIGGRASAVAPTDVTTNGDVVNAWFLRNGALASVLTAAGALIGGDATNGLDVDVTRLPALVAGSANIGDVDVLTVPAPLSTTGGGTEATALRVTIANDSTGRVEVQGDVASDAPIVANPNTVGARASTAVPTAVSADGDAVNVWASRSGALVQTQAPHVGLNSDPWNLVHEGAQYTTTQTSAVLVTGAASEKIVITQIQIQAYGTNAGDCIVYFGTGAFARGTNRSAFDGTFKPSATSAPGFTSQGPFVAGTNGDDILVTTTNNLNVTISVWYYVVV